MINEINGTWKYDPKYNNFQGIISPSSSRILQIDWSNQCNGATNSARTQVHHRNFDLKLVIKCPTSSFEK